MQPINFIAVSISEAALMGFYASGKIIRTALVVGDIITIAS